MIARDGHDRADSTASSATPRGERREGKRRDWALTRVRKSGGGFEVDGGRYVDGAVGGGAGDGDRSESVVPDADEGWLASRRQRRRRRLAPDRRHDVALRRVPSGRVVQRRRIPVRLVRGHPDLGRHQRILLLGRLVNAGRVGRIGGGDAARSDRADRVGGAGRRPDRTDRVGGAGRARRIGGVADRVVRRRGRGGRGGRRRQADAADVGDGGGRGGGRRQAGAQEVVERGAGLGVASVQVAQNLVLQPVVVELVLVLVDDHVRHVRNVQIVTGHGRANVTSLDEQQREQAQRTQPPNADLHFEEGAENSRAGQGVRSAKRPNQRIEKRIEPQPNETIISETKKIKKKKNNKNEETKNKSARAGVGERRVSRGVKF